MLTPFPFGTRPLQFRECGQAAYNAYIRRMGVKVSEVPIRHPILTQLDGDYPVKPILPSWWTDMLLNSKLDFYHKLVLGTITPEEYVDGKVAQQTIKALRAVVPNDIKKVVPASPSIAKWMDGLDSSYVKAFNDRGTPGDERVLRITSQPEDIFYMSNGLGWTSCQHWNGSSYAEQLLGTLYDHTVGMAVFIPKSKDVQMASLRGDHNGVLEARLLMRVVHIVGSVNPVIMLDRTYGTDSGIQKALRRHVCTLLCTMNIPHCVGYTSTVGYDTTNTVETDIIAHPDTVRDSYHDTLNAVLSATCSDGFIRLRYSGHAGFQGNV